MRHVAVCLAVAVVGGVRAADPPPAKPPTAEDRIPVLSAGQAGDLEGRVGKLLDRVTPAVVRVWTTDEAGKAFDGQGRPLGGAFSGVVIGADGLVLTCAHHGRDPGVAAVVEFPDGRRADAVHLGRFEPPGRKDGQAVRQPDLGLVRITAKGEWPAVPVGPAAPPAPGTLCLAIGYPGPLPAKARPLVRLARVVAEGTKLRVTAGTVSGDSGGPLFDPDGRVVGVLSGIHPAAGYYQPVGPLAEHRKGLEAGKVLSAPSPEDRWLPLMPADLGAFAADPAFRTKLVDDGRCAVRVLGGGVEVAAGLAVDPDGWVVTKRTLVAGRDDLACYLPWSLNAEYVVPAAVAAESAEHDLALLRLDRARLRRILPNGLPAPRWAEAGPPAGRLVVVPRGLRGQAFGVVGAAAGPAPPPPGTLPQIPVEVKAGPAGEVVPVGPDDATRPDTDVGPWTFRPGDVVTHLGGAPTPTLADYHRAHDRLLYAHDAAGKLAAPWAAAPGSLAGEPVVFTVRRGGAEVRVRVARISNSPPQAHVTTWKFVPLSLRRDGFPAVFAHDAWVAPEQCGGPLLDLDGKVVGLNIAKADPARTLAIPAEVVRKVVAELRNEADRKSGGM